MLAPQVDRFDLSGKIKPLHHATVRLAFEVQYHSWCTRGLLCTKTQLRSFLCLHNKVHQQRAELMKCRCC